MIVYLELWQDGNQSAIFLKYDGSGFVPSIGDIIIGNYKNTKEEVFVHGKVFERLVSHSSIIVRIKQF